MPRIESPHEPEQRTTIDLCRPCYARSKVTYEDKGWETEVAHPPYEETRYACASCGKSLDEKDNL